MNEPTLWMSFKTGSMDAFSSIYRMYGNTLCAYSMRLTSDKKFAEDAVHDLFIELWEKRERLGEVYSLKYYLLKCLHRKIIKSKSTKPSLPLDEKRHTEPVPSIEEVILHEEEEHIKKKYIHRGIDTLSKREQEAIYLKYYRDFTTEKMATTLSLSTKGTYNLISRSIVSLREHLRVPLKQDSKFRDH
ncbi:MAG TPA: sigma-70 family RNA polymerase sigma factor [Cyclobacteriaceae bacterium]|nr:sigma-70 family RNA polymerase sigma factor [Cyclobacteriaceae bacterium]